MAIMETDVEKLKEHIKSKGLKQKHIAEAAGIKEVRMCMILKGKRKCDAEEYISICHVLHVQPEEFMRRNSK